MEAAVELKNIECVRDGYRILKDVSHIFPLGKTTVVMGFSGSGRSTLLKVTAGLTLPESGNVLIQGKDFGKLSEKELLKFRGTSGFVFQDSALWANLSTYQNLSLPLQFHRQALNAGEVDSIIQGLVQDFDFRDNLQLRPASLSSGEKKLVSFIRALVLDPELLIMDEPTSFVDNISAERILRVLKRLKGMGRTMIIATHSPALTSQLADYLVILKDGAIIEQGELKTLTHSKNQDVIEVLSDVLSEAATYDTDLLNLLETDPE